MKFIRFWLLLLGLSQFSVLANSDYAKELDNTTKHSGFFTFYHDDANGRVLLEIEQFEQDFLFQSGLPHGVGSNDIGLDRGQLGDTRLVRFERVGKKVFLRQLNSYYRANSDNTLEQEAVEQAFASSIIWGFELIASDQGKWLIDYTPFLLSDIHNLADRLKQRKQGSFALDKSRSGVYAKRSKSFPDNTELEAIITFKGKGTGDYLKSVAPEANAITVNLHHSLIRLPDDNYQTRAFHPFSGFWSVEYADYATPIEHDIVKRVIPRHRLTKKDPKSAVSEAVEPIVYYLDAGVPEPVRSALIDGALWWDQAFEAIGYKNAFQVKMLPADADPMDVRYNVIQWVHRATRGWSYGASVIDPRTGEIIKGHVTLGSLRVRQDYLIALGLTSPFTNNNHENADTSAMKEMALARIRQLSAHEVGHTLGIAHNFAASVNDRASVMDYPHPYVSIKDEKIDLSQAYDDKIGVWDKYVIAYGYGDNNQASHLAKLVADAQAQGLQYISDPDARPQSGAHPAGHLWDNGQDPVAELKRVMKVRQLALSNFGLNSIAVGTPLSELEQTLVPIYNFHRYQVEAAVKLVAGVDYYYELKSAESAQGAVTVSGDKQKQALSAILATLSPEVLTLSEDIVRLIPPKAYGYRRNRESFPSNTGLTFDPVSAASASASHSLNLLLNKQRLARLAQQAALDENIPSVASLLMQLMKNTIAVKPHKGLSSVIQQRVNQQVIEQLVALWQQEDVVPEVKADVYAHLVELKTWLSKNANSRKYRSFEHHFVWLAKSIELSLAKGKLVLPTKAVKLPPGSPIGQY